jgi:adenine-specific DNA-methyltransferase
MSGQYFTTDLSLQQCVYDFIRTDPKCILEPSVGEGHLLRLLKNVDIDAYEIDNSLVSVPGVIYTDFLTHPIDKLYECIIGNPPYVKTKQGNLYIDFIEKCFSLLDDMGELIFIVPSDFSKLTCAGYIINLMMEEGSFTDIYHPHDESLFDGAMIDVLVFRYQKSVFTETLIYNNVEKHVRLSNGILTFESGISSVCVNTLFNVYVGMVSGLEKVYKTPIGNIKILTSKDEYTRYIFTEVFPTEDEQINSRLLEFKQELITRKIRKFGEHNWYEWGAPRNKSIMISAAAKPCIYVMNITREHNIAFVGKVGLFGAKLLMMLPLNDSVDLESVVNELNSESFREKYTYSGRFKIGQKNLLNSFIR